MTAAPPGTVQRLKLQSVKPLTYDIDTKGYDGDTVLPVRIILHNVTQQRSRTIRADPIRVTAGDDCGCFDWVAVPPEGRGTTSRSPCSRRGLYAASR